MAFLGSEFFNSRRGISGATIEKRVSFCVQSSTSIEERKSCAW